MSPDDTGANTVVFEGLKFVLGTFGVVSLDDGELSGAAVDVVFAGLKFVLGAFRVVSLDDGESSEAAVDTVVGLVTRVTSSGVDGAARVSSIDVKGSSNDVNVVEIAAEIAAEVAAEVAAAVAAAMVSSAGSNGPK